MQNGRKSYFVKSVFCSSEIISPCEWKPNSYNDNITTVSVYRNWTNNRDLKTTWRKIFSFCSVLQFYEVRHTINRKLSKISWNWSSIADSFKLYCRDLCRVKSIIDKDCRMLWTTIYVQYVRCSHSCYQHIVTKKSICWKSTFRIYRIKWNPVNFGTPIFF